MFIGAGGIGKEVAEWLINGESTQELSPFNVQRFMDLHTNRQYLQQRIREVIGRNYAILYPHQCEYKYARKLRCSPLYSVLEERGAIFGIKMAYERALYFDSTYRSKFTKKDFSAFLYRCKISKNFIIIFRKTKETSNASWKLLQT